MSDSVDSKCNVVTSNKLNKQITENKYEEIEEYKECDLRQKVNNENPRCFITGIPIYEDCYVVDIYKQTVVKEINISELEEEKNQGSVVVENKNEVRKKSNRKQKAIKSTNIKTVTIEKTVLYDEPIHILLSPYIVHFDNEFDFIVPNISFSFNRFTKSDVIVYRTFCPRLAGDVINNLPKDQYYKNILLAFNGVFNNTKDCYESHFQQKKYVILKSIFTNNKILSLKNESNITICSSYEKYNF